VWLLGRVSVRRKYQILGLCFLSLGVFLSLALASHDARDTTADLVGTGAVRNQAGVLGALAAQGLVAALGIVGAWIAPIGLFAWGWNRLRIRPAGDLWMRSALAATAFLAGIGLLDLLFGEERGLVGALGTGIGRLAERLLGRVGGELLLGTALVVIGVIAFELGAASPLRRLLSALLARFAPDRKKRRAAAAAAGANDSAVAEPLAADGLKPRRARKGPAE